MQWLRYSFCCSMLRLRHRVNGFSGLVYSAKFRDPRRAEWDGNEVVGSPLLSSRSPLPFSVMRPFFTAGGISNMDCRSGNHFSHALRSIICKAKVQAELRKRTAREGGHHRSLAVRFKAKTNIERDAGSNMSSCPETTFLIYSRTSSE